MERTGIGSLVRDLDLTVQPRVSPRYKAWLPLATQQLRLRNLIQVTGYNLQTSGKSESCWFYYTLHRTSMSSPLYTSEPLDNRNPRWANLEVPMLHATGHSTASEIVIRLWIRTKTGDTVSDESLFAWGISFTGLEYIGPKLPHNMEKILHNNSLIFHFHGGYFVPSYSLLTVTKLKRYTGIGINTCDVRDSYTVNKLSSLRNKMQALKQQTESVQMLRMRIASGDETRAPRYPQSSLNRLLQPRKVNREKKMEIMRMKKELEMAKFRNKLLEQERARKTAELRALSQLHANVSEENQDKGSILMERYRELNKDIERLNEWRHGHMDSAETYVQKSAQLTHRRRQLISELNLIYPIRQEDDGKFTIHDIHLPDSENFEFSNDTQVAVALGFVAHTTQMVANFLNIPTRYQIVHYGSRSKVIDHINERLTDNTRKLPLFARSKDNEYFNYAVFLLNISIGQLRWYCGLPTNDLRATLPNLASLISIKPNQSHSLTDTEISNTKHRTPLTPPFQRVFLQKSHKSSRSMNQLKSIKSSLGASLDQGLDKPPQSLALSSRSKRICKSEESAIDVKVLALPKESSSDEASNETTICTSVNDVKNEEETGNARTNVTWVDDDVEITIPTSVSKPEAINDSFENPCSRGRSSNSISSCEMALSSSQNDAEDEEQGIEEDVESVKSDEIAGSFAPEGNYLDNIHKMVSSQQENTSRESVAPENKVEGFGSKGKQRDVRTSTEYIDSMRRSSENVFARTEALANKKSSFKVMRPRL